MLVAGGDERAGLPGEHLCRGAVGEEAAHGGTEGVRVARRDDGAVLAFDDYLAAAVDVGHYRGQSHGAGLDDHVGEAFAVTGEDECVRGGEPRAHVGLLAYGLYVFVIVYFRERLGLQGVKLRLLTADEDKPCGRKLSVQAAEGLHELVDALVPDQASHEHEGEHARPADFRSLGPYFGQSGIIVREVNASHVAVAEDLQRLPGDVVVDKVVLHAFPFGYDMRGAGAGDASVPWRAGTPGR